MSCFRPLVAYWYKPEYLTSRPGGLERPVFISEYLGEQYDYSTSLRVPLLARPCLQRYLLPCGHCVGCRADNALQWTFRGLCELDEHPDSCFLTLTVDDEHMDKVFPGRKLSYRPFQLFLKRLRKAISPASVRYMMCGEYGTQSLRPHFHCILFGWHPSDLTFLSCPTGTYDVYVSDIIRRLWSDPDNDESYGFHTVSEANEQTLRYLVGYVLKKANPVYPQDAPPFLHSSSRPALGLHFFERYYRQLYAHGSDLTFPNQYVYCGSRKMKLPRYFDKRFAFVADNVDYVSLLKYRSTQVDKFHAPDFADLRRHEDYFNQVSKSAKIRRNLEV